MRHKLKTANNPFPPCCILHSKTQNEQLLTYDKNGD